MTPPIPPRPIYGSPENRERCVQQVLGRVTAWAKDMDVDLVSRSLFSAFNPDAYRWARALDRHKGWEPDAELVEILSNTSLHAAHDEMVREWVKRYGITVPFQRGDRVATPHHRAATVSTIYRGLACMMIQPDGEEDIWAGQPYGGHRIDFETAVRICGTIGAEVPA
jgi:hypothetical protein